MYMYIYKVFLTLNLFENFLFVLWLRFLMSIKWIFYITVKLNIFITKFVFGLSSVVKIEYLESDTVCINVDILSLKKTGKL